jgi:S1-C subfamily serine protease
MKNFPFSILALILMPLLLHGNHARARLPEEQNNVEIYQRCSSAVVNITTVTLTQDFFFDIVPQKGLGSGAIIRADGYIVTNDHVVGNSQQVEVTLGDKSQFKAKVVGSDPDSDLAVIKINPGGKKLSSIDYADWNSVAVGQKVLAIGNPFGLGGSLSVGIVSSLGRDIRSPTDRIIKDVIQTDAAINPGNSGGPLLDSSGKLIGINAQIFSRSGGSEGIGFAIPGKTVKKIVDELITHGKVIRPDLGMRGIGFNEDILNSLNIALEYGVMITRLDPRGPLGRAGLRPANQQLVYGFHRIPIGGDIIHQIDSQKVGSMRDILDYLSDKKIGDSVVIHYVRKGVKKNVTVKLSRSAEDRGDEL